LYFSSKVLELFSNEKESQLVFFVLIFKKNFTVSHVPERKEKDCLNCGTTVYGKYCHICGQENVVPKETFWSMFIHFFYDITHFDSKFFESIKDLIFRPGFLSKEFNRGRRASYLHPVRMYVFTSAIFFLVFFSFIKPGETFKTNINQPVPADVRRDYIKSLQQKLKKDTGNILLKEKLICAKDTNCLVTYKDIAGSNNGGIRIGLTDTKYNKLEEYDSAQKILPSSERDGWFRRRLIRKKIELNNKFNENPDEAMKEFGESLLHRLPYMLFISLPLFAFILKLVYIRRKQFYFADHGVFTIHLYVFTFLLLLAVFGFNALQQATGLDVFGWLIFILFLALFFYLYKAMRNFYGQRRFKTFIKFLLVALISLLMMLILFLFFLFFSAVTL
jgi:hypothetical protein